MKRDQIIIIRVTELEKKAIMRLAYLYADGDLSVWMRHAGTSAMRKKLKGASTVKQRRPKVQFID
jgi:hypothetical protein